ncbi:MAG: hypothetical protein FWF83_02565 [Clostridiales bacterium]|nr:hypothetical protein [Clostridiales bacterium]
MSVLGDFKDSLLFEIQKEFWNERGKGARYRLTLVGTDFISKMVKDPSDKQEIVDFLKKEGFCSDIEISEDEFTINLKVKDCAFIQVRDKFMDKQATFVNVVIDQQPLSCPIANVIMRAEEIVSGLGPELLPIERNGNECIVGMGKMGSADVIDKV